MKGYKTIFPLLFLIFISGLSYGNDSILYKKRVEQIIALAQWLNITTHHESDSRRTDTTIHRKIYDTAIQMFFNNTSLDSKYNLKISICEFDNLLRDFPIDSFVLRMPEPNRDTLIRNANFSYYFKNTIIFYLPMYGEEFEGLYFVFADNSSQLIYMITAGGTPEQYKEKKAFINKLYSRKLRPT